MKRSSWNWLFLVSAFGMALMFVYLVTQESLPEWKSYQSAYNRHLAEVTGEPSHARAPLEVRQIYLPHLNRVDRCTICHLGVDNPVMKDAPQPFASHPDLGIPEFLTAHPFEEIGCTVCHDGQGRATTKEAAHGHEKHWEKPMLSSGLIVSNCATCHGNINQLRGAEKLVMAQVYFKEWGCIGCHQLDGWGNQVGPELSETANKAHQQLDFRHIKGEHTVANWIYEHFLDPQKVTPADPGLGIPESSMPNYEMTEEEAEMLTALVLSYAARAGNELRPIPARFKVPGVPETPAEPASDVEAGRRLYTEFGCAACHGPGGRGGIRNKNMDMGEEVPPLVYVADGFTDEELKETIRHGRFPGRSNRDEDPPPLWMPAWKSKFSEEQLDQLVAYLKSLRPEETDQPTARLSRKEAQTP